MFIEPGSSGFSIQISILQIKQKKRSNAVIAKQRLTENHLLSILWKCRNAITAKFY